MAIVCLTLLATGWSGCSDRDPDPGPPVPTPPTTPRVINDVAGALSAATGNVDYCTDPSPARHDALRRFNATFSQRNLKATIHPLPPSTLEQRRMFLNGSVCDVYDSDVVWMAEWAAQGRVYNMRPYIQHAEQRGQTFIPNTLTTAEFAGRYWGVPHTTNAGVLFYRTDAGLSRNHRATWQAVYNSAKARNEIVYQAAPPEPLTVNFLELAFAAGGRVLSRDGRRSVINSPQNAAALRFMVDGILRGAAPEDVLSYDENKTEAAFERGATFMRNWPDKFDRLQRTPIRGQYAVAPLPIFEHAGVAGVLGGANLVIDAQADNPDGALALIDFLINPRQQARGLAAYSEPAVLVQTYRDSHVRQSVPFADELFRAIRQARPRPVSPAYHEISDAISTNVHNALKNRATVSATEALQQAHADIRQALAKAANP